MSSISIENFDAKFGVNVFFFFAFAWVYIIYSVKLFFRRYPIKFERYKVKVLFAKMFWVFDIKLFKLETRTW